MPYLCHREAGTLPTHNTSKQMTVATAFPARVATLDSETLRSLYRQMFNQPLVPFQALDIVLNRLMDLDGVESVDAFIDTVA